MENKYTAAGRVVTGLSHPVVAPYQAPGGLTSYRNGRILARLRSYSTNIATAGDSNQFYVDNAVGENAGDVFTSGTLSLEVDGLLPETERFVYGLPEPKTVDIGGTEVTYSGLGTNTASAVLGLGMVVEMRCNNVTSYSIVIFPKVTFRQGGDEAKTREKEIDWQTRTFTVDLARDDTGEHMWRYNIENYFESENDAIALLHKIMGVPEASNG